MDKKLNQEKSELARMINEGFEFTVEGDLIECKPLKHPLLRALHVKHFHKVHRIQTFKISEPTLGTLDRLSKEWVELAIEDEGMKELDDISKARRFVAKDARRCARIVALAVMGSDYLKAKSHGRRMSFEADEVRCEELTDLFMRTVKPSQLYQMMVFISLACNLGDFLSSIRLMCANRTTMPNRIEDTEEA